MVEEWRRNKYGGLFRVGEIYNNINTENYKDDFNNIDNEAKNVIKAYTDENSYYNYDRINGSINSFGINGANEEVQRRARIIEKAINQNEIKENSYVYRVIDKRDILKDSKGYYIQNQGFTSTSATENIPVDFIDSENKIKIKIQVQKGTKALYIGERTEAIVNEQEFLFGLNKRIDIKENYFNKNIINGKMRK